MRDNGGKAFPVPVQNRLASLGWQKHPRIGAGFSIYAPQYNVPVALIEAYPPLPGKRVPGAKDAQVMAKIVLDCVNNHDALCEALLEALPAIDHKHGIARAMVIRALDNAGSGAGLTDDDLRFAACVLDGVAFRRTA